NDHGHADVAGTSRGRDRAGTDAELPPERRRLPVDARRSGVLPERPYDRSAGGTAHRTLGGRSDAAPGGWGGVVSRQAGEHRAGGPAGDPRGGADGGGCGTGRGADRLGGGSSRLARAPRRLRLTESVGGLVAAVAGASPRLRDAGAPDSHLDRALLPGSSE